MNINSNSGQFKTQGDTIKLSEQHFKMKTANLWEQKVSPSFKKNGRLLQTVQNKSGLFPVLF